MANQLTGSIVAAIAIAIATSAGCRAPDDGSLSNGESPRVQLEGPRPNAASGLSVDDVETRRARIRKYFADRLQRLDIVATTRAEDGRFIDWIPRSPSLAEPPEDTILQSPPDISDPEQTVAPSGPSHGPQGAVSRKNDMLAMTEVQAKPWLRGPVGTVPIVRFDVEAYLELTDPMSLPERPEDVLSKLADPAPSSNNRYYGVWRRTERPFYGTSGAINVWNTSQGSTHDTSIGQVAILRGTPMQAVEAGRIKSPLLNGTSVPHLFVYFRTSDSSQGDWAGGYNSLVDGWQQVSATVAPGMQLTNLSTLGGNQYSLEIEVLLDSNRNWWVKAAGEWAGYYPRCKFGSPVADCRGAGFLFSTAGIRNEASRIDWYGEVYDSSAPLPTATEMGSGRFASEGFGRAAYMRALRYTWAPGTSWWWDGSTVPSATDAGCYSVNGPYFQTDSSVWYNYFYFGGPGSAALTCL